MVDRRPSASYGLTQLEKRVEGEAPGSGLEKVGAGWVAVHWARSDQWSQPSVTPCFRWVGYPLLRPLVARAQQADFRAAPALEQGPLIG